MSDLPSREMRHISEVTYFLCNGRRGLRPSDFDYMIQSPYTTGAARQRALRSISIEMSGRRTKRDGSPTDLTAEYR